MAEARNAIDLYYLQKRGIEIAGVEDGYYTLTLSLPYPKTVFQATGLRVKQIWNYVQNRIWPAKPETVLTAMAAVSALALYSSSNSWIRSGQLANVLWNLDNFFNRLNPLHTKFPVQFRVFYLSSIATFVGMLTIMAGERLLLRCVLNYTGWLYLKPAQFKKPPMKIKLWGGLVTLFSGHINLTYGFSLSLPSLPLPSLKHTVEKYLESVEPLFEEQDFIKTQEEANKFLKNEGKKLQRFLRLRHLTTKNYVAEWWEKYVYLRGRTPLCVNSNYYITDSKFRPTTDQVTRAANIVHYFLEFKDMIQNETLEPLLIRGKIPLCMNQYSRMFGTCRIPGREGDSLKNNNSRNIAVLYKGEWFEVDVYKGARGTKLVRLSVKEIMQQLQFIIEFVEESKKRSESGNESDIIRKGSGSFSIKPSKIKSYSDLVVLNSKLNRLVETADENEDEEKTRSFIPAKNKNVSVLTALPRSQWAEIREIHFSEGINRRSLLSIEKAAFVLVLEDETLHSLQDRAKSLFTGNGYNRYFDKSIELIVYPDGYAGLNTEHSWADAPPVAHLWEFALLKELTASNLSHPQTLTSSASGVSNGSQNSSKADKAFQRPKYLPWNFNSDLLQAMDSAHFVVNTLINEVELYVLEFNHFGAEFAKKHGMSPDGFVQMAIQLAYYRDRAANGREGKRRFDLTYESSMTRLFYKGRTETVRTLSKESCSFVEMMQKFQETPELGITKANVIAALLQACEIHNEKSKDAMAGKGIDRHLFALYIVSRGFDIESKFLNGALTVPWRLSTSQQTQNQTNLRKYLTEDIAIKFLSPGGGFGPVADDGYGVSYMMVTNKVQDVIFFHVSAKKGEVSTNSEVFAKRIERALRDMHDLFV